MLVKLVIWYKNVYNVKFILIKLYVYLLNLYIYIDYKVISFILFFLYVYIIKSIKFKKLNKYLNLTTYYLIYYMYK
jgi:hypothetical protein